MRVLHINGGNLYGGIETFLTVLARSRHLCRDMEPSFALCFDGRPAEELREAGVALHVLGPTRVSRPWTLLRARHALRQVLQQTAPDVVVMHGPWSHSIFAPVVRRLRIPLVFWAHGPATGGHWLERWASWTPPDLVIADSRWTRDNFRLFPTMPTEVLYYPVADASSANRQADRASVRSDLRTPDETVVIVQVSRMEAWKGHRLLLDALARLRDVAGWECWIVGGPQRPEEERYQAELQAQATRAGIAERVRFLGQRRDVPRILAAADIHCQANLSPEPFGITFVEALYAGLPVVTVAHGGPLEILDETCGLLTPPGDHVKLAEALRTLIDQPAFRRRLGQAGPARARHLCDPATMLNSISGCLSVLTGKQGQDDVSISSSIPESAAAR